MKPGMKCGINSTLARLLLPLSYNLWIATAITLKIPGIIKAGFKKTEIFHMDFIAEYSNCSRGYVICRIPRAQKLTDTVTALPWGELHMVLEDR